MPWKTTKLVFCGVPIRRRTLYNLALFFSIVCVPTLSWALLALEAALTRGQQIGFAVAAVISLGLALNSWRLILKHHTQLFQEEARLIWPGAILLLLAATGFACFLDHQAMKRGRMDFIVPLAFGGFLLIVFLVKCFQLGSVPKRGDIVRGDSGRRHSHSQPSATPVPEESVAVEAPKEEIEDDEGPAPPPEDSPS